MVQRATQTDDLEGTLEVTDEQVWADFRANLDAQVIAAPGPEWKSMTEIKAEFATLGRSWVERWVAGEVAAGRMETRRGPDRRTGKVMALYRIVRG